MCRYCENGATPLFKDGKAFGVCLGNTFGFAGFTARSRKWKDSRTRIVMSPDKKARIMLGGCLSAPIEFCPKCGRNLLTSHKPSDKIEM